MCFPSANPNDNLDLLVEFTLKIRPSRDGPRGTEEPESPAAGRDHAGCAAAGGPAEHAGVAAEGDGQMFQEMYHQSGLLPGQQRPEVFISVYGQVRPITLSQCDSEHSLPAGTWTHLTSSPRSTPRS